MTSPGPHENVGWLGLVLAGLLLWHSAWNTAFWTNTARAVLPDGLSYEQRRIVYGFNRVPIDQIRTGLDAFLPRGVAVALDPNVWADPFLSQRLTEGLYPRIVDNASPHVLTLAENAPPSDPTAKELARFGSEKVLYLQGPPTIAGPLGPAASRPPPDESFELSWLQFLACLAGAAGLGWGLLRVVRRSWPADGERPGPLAILICAAFLGVLGSVSTWLQIRLPRMALGMLGMALFVAATAQVLRRGGPEVLRGAVAAGRRNPENLLAAAALAAFLARVARFPIVMWDGRSIWFFHARQIFTHGRFSTQDALRPEAQWSHTTYPLLFPGWIAQFSSFSPAYNERLASLGIPVLLAAVLAPIWILSRKALGRWPGAAFTVALFFSVETLCAGGYVDGFVMLFFVLALLALFTPGYQLVGWISVLVLSLLKQEGLVFGALASVAALVAHRPSGEPGPPAPRRWSPLLVLAPAVLHASWAKWIGLEGAFHGIRWPEVFGDLPGRLGVILGALPEVLTRFPLLGEGLVGLLAVGIIRAAGPERRNRLATAAAALATASFGFAVVALVLTPHDLKWHVDSSLDRLLLHPSALFVLAALLLARNETRAAPPS
ncbi:MAG TPA: hypothetical protein VGW35_05890 [Methylomirabilota bacterium]|nr:hypothetical protein [Methylomirabilota bacterium]